jgi:hypothetical protein
MAAVALQFTVDSASMETEMICNLLDLKALFFEGGQYIPIMRGELSIFHRVESLLGWSENT